MRFVVKNAIVKNKGKAEIMIKKLETQEQVNKKLIKMYICLEFLMKRYDNASAEDREKLQELVLKTFPIELAVFFDYGASVDLYFINQGNDLMDIRKEVAEDLKKKYKKMMDD